MKFHSSYKGVFYQYVPEKNIWKLADREDEMGRLMTFNADVYRIDQCFDEFFKEQEDERRLG